MALKFPALDAAIARAEGFGKAGAIPTRANNPGDIVYGDWATRHGADGYLTAAGGQKIATFPSVEVGTQAMDDLISNNYAGGTMGDLAAKWLSGSPQTEIENWLKNTGIAADTPVSDTGGPKEPWSLPDFLGNVITFGQLGKIKEGGAAVGAKVETVLGFPVMRVTAFALGLLVIAGGLFLLKPVQEAAIKAARV